MNTLQEQRQHYAAVRQRIMAAAVYWDPPTERVSRCPTPTPAPAPPPEPAEPTFRLIYRFPIGPSRTSVQPFRKSAAEVLQEVSEEYGVSIEALKSGKRAFALVRARQCACYRMRSETRLSLPQIGRALGGRDHTTVLHGCRAHAKLLNLPDAGLI